MSDRTTAVLLVALALATVAWLRSAPDDLDGQIAQQQAAIRAIHADRLRRQQELEAARVEFEGIPDVVQALEQGHAETEPLVRRLEDDLIRDHQRAIGQLQERACRETRGQC